MATSSDGTTTVSIFRGAPASAEHIALEMGKLSQVFTSQTKEFYKVLMERIKANGMTDEQLKQSVNRTIDTCKYPTFSIADIVGYDIRCRVYSYNEMGAEMARTGGTQKEYAPLYFRGEQKPMWVTRSDKLKYQIPDML